MACGPVSLSTLSAGPPQRPAGFLPTRWTLVLRARGESPAEQGALEELCEAYSPGVHMAGEIQSRLSVVTKVLRQFGREPDGIEIELVPDCLQEHTRQNPLQEVAVVPSKVRQLVNKRNTTLTESPEHAIRIAPPGDFLEAEYPRCVGEREQCKQYPGLIIQVRPRRLRGVRNIPIQFLNFLFDPVFESVRWNPLAQVAEHTELADQFDWATVLEHSRPATHFPLECRLPAIKARLHKQTKSKPISPRILLQFGDDCVTTPVDLDKSFDETLKPVEHPAASNP